jgi:acetyl-CoA carboxylase, biotin carboxylase subunit
MFRKILIANRGEIALRIMCACKELGIKTVAVYSEADRHNLHVRFADEAICIGPAKSSRSYLDIPSVISAAEITNVDAVHPGYGFLSENPDFAEVCELSGIKFIGPKPGVIREMGSKQRARALMEDLGVPILPGSRGILKGPEEALALANEIGYPVMLKAAAGGGGRGMRMVCSEAELPALLAQAQSEAAAAFSSGDVYMEKLVQAPRHIEFQILADEYGDVEVLGERECSIQRRHQKVLEESPSPSISSELRTRMSDRLRAAMKRIGYTNAGTVEFLMDEHHRLHFIEVNARIQVEHPVTEFVTGIDIVKAQIRIAAGEELCEILTRPVSIEGHAIQCRINAEHPETFAPSPGRITGLNLPGGIGVRVDTAAYTDGIIPPYYDSLVAKLIAYGKDRHEAIQRMKRALSMFVVEGIHTTISLHERILSDDDFVAGRFDTSFLSKLSKNHEGVEQASTPRPVENEPFSRRDVQAAVSASD